MQFSAVKLDVLTPVHIGTGELLDPMSYVIKVNNGEKWLYNIDFSAWIDAHHNPDSVTNFFNDKKVGKIRKYIYENVDEKVYSRYKAQVYSDKIYEEYTEKLKQDNDNGFNQLKISPALKNQNNFAAIIPGSSLKGAIRTAIIDRFDSDYHLGLREVTFEDEQNRRKQKRKYDKLLEKLFGEIKDNKFKQLKVSDFEAKTEQSIYITAEEVSKNPSIINHTPKDPCEVVPGKIMSENAISIFGKIVIGRYDTDFIKIGDRELTLQGIMDICNDFYIKRYFKEKQLFYMQPHLSETKKKLDKIEDDILNVKAGEMILRVGHYSHIECVTITNNSPFTRKNKNGRRYPFGTTRTLANGVYPFGWVKLTLCEDIEYCEYLRAKKINDQESIIKFKRLREDIILKNEGRKKDREERIRKELIEKKREKEKQKKLAAMSEDERLIYEMEVGEIVENDVYNLYQMLDNLSGEKQLNAAISLRNYWQVKGKWNKKNCSKKQNEKVKKIKKILGEE